MSSQHKGKFTWGVGPERVCVSGNFNNWSDTATPLHKQADGSFAADVPLPWGEKQPFKYVVDGEWKVREDEAKEWDAAGNMNNVYTAPHAPSSSEAAPAPAAAAAAAPASEAAPAPSVPSSSSPDTAPAPATESTNANSLVAAAVPTAGMPAAAGGSEPVLGNTRHITGSGPTTEAAPAEAKPSAVGVPAAAGGSEPVLGNVHHITSQPNTDPSTAQPGNTAPVVNNSAPDAIQKVAANANIGQEATETDKTMLERAQELGAGAAVTLGAALGSAAHVVEDVTGVNLTHGAPLTVEEAKARGIDVENLEKVDAPTDATSPVGQAPPKDAVAALEEKTRELRVDDGVTAGKSQLAAVPLPGGDAPKTMEAPASSLPKPTEADKEPKHDLPAQNETSENHTTVPAPAIVAISTRDPTKDRTIDAAVSKDTTGTKPISSDPGVDAADAKKEAEKNPALTGSTPGEAKTSSKTNNLGDSAADVGSRPDAPEANFDAPPPSKKDIAPGQAAPAPAPVSKDAPSTPAKTNGGAASAASTPASTPAKSTHEREATGSSDVKKRKSGFLHKFKSAFSPKDKEKK